MNAPKTPKEEECVALKYRMMWGGLFVVALLAGLVIIVSNHAMPNRNQLSERILAPGPPTPDLKVDE